MPFVFSASLNGTSSIYNFNVTNCQVDTALVGCEEDTVEFSCDISNSAFIDYVEFRIDGTLYNASKTGFNWAFDFLKINQTFTVNQTISLDRIYITDTNSDTAIFDEDIGFLNDCLTCSDVGYQDACGVDDTTVFHHIYEPFNCSVDYNETVSCDYCEEDLVGVEGECFINNTQIVNYYDNNYFSCCDVTGLLSDCSILYSPYNDTVIQACSYLTQDFSCNIPEVVEFDDKMTFSCLLPDNEDYSCVVKVFEDSRLVQVNPENTVYNDGLISIGSKKEETKEFFNNENQILNAYFTKKNLLTDKQFLVEVECSSEDEVYVSQQLVNPFYEDASWVLNRTNWARQNVWYIIIGLLLAVVIVGIIIYSLKESGIKRWF